MAGHFVGNTLRKNFIQSSECKVFPVWGGSLIYATHWMWLSSETSEKQIGKNFWALFQGRRQTNRNFILPVFALFKRNFVTQLDWLGPPTPPTSITQLSMRILFSLLFKKVIDTTTLRVKGFITRFNLHHTRRETSSHRHPTGCNTPIPTRTFGSVSWTCR